MRRRGVICGFSAAAVWPVEALGRGKVWRVGFLGAASPSAYMPLVDAIKAGLKSYGYVEGTSLLFESRWAEGKYDRLPALAAELIGRGIDVMVTHGTPGTLAAERATTSVPIIMAIIGDPVAVGVVNSIGRPDRNVTGSSFFAPQLAAKRIELLKDAIPGLRTVGLLANPGNASMAEVLELAKKTAGPLGVDVEVFQVRSVDELGGAFPAMASRNVQALVVPEDGLLISNAKTIAELSLKARLPVIGFRQIVQAGGAMSYGVNIPKTFERAAYFIDRIFKGARPQDLPIEEATNFEFVVNTKTLKALGIVLTPTLLARADKLIE